MRPPNASRYDRYGRLERSVLVACAAALVALSVGLMLAPVKTDAAVVHGLGVILAAVTVFFLARVIRYATIDISGQSVVVRGLVSTKRFQLADVEKFTVVGGFEPSGREKGALAVRKRSGALSVFPDFNTGSIPVVELAGRLNAELNALRISTALDAA